MPSLSLKYPPPLIFLLQPTPKLPPLVQMLQIFAMQLQSSNQIGARGEPWMAMGHVLMCPSG
jgi:hypothetical protein